jgi:hypothetical protein
MSDPIAVALASGGFTAFAGALGSYFTWRAGNRQAETAVNVARTQAEVERQKVEAEAEATRRQYREEERRNRQAHYLDFIVAADRLRSLMLGDIPFTPDVSDRRVQQVATTPWSTDALRRASGGECERAAVSRVQAGAGRTRRDPLEIEPGERRRRAYTAHEAELNTALDKVIEAMRTDVTSVLQP